MIGWVDCQGTNLQGTTVESDMTALAADQGRIPCTVQGAGIPAMLLLMMGDAAQIVCGTDG